MKLHIHSSQNINASFNKEQNELRNSWLQILTILKELGYDKLYSEDISRVANVIRKELELDK